MTTTTLTPTTSLARPRLRLVRKIVETAVGLVASLGRQLAAIAAGSQLGPDPELAASRAAGARV
jgi:hypothetical protein